MKVADIKSIMINLISSETGLPEGDIVESNSFDELGLDSIRAMYLLDKLENRLKITINPYWFWEFPTIDKLAAHLKTITDE